MLRRQEAEMATWLARKRSHNEARLRFLDASKRCAHRILLPKLCWAAWVSLCHEGEGEECRRLMAESQGMADVIKKEKEAQDEVTRLLGWDMLLHAIQRLLLLAKQRALRHWCVSARHLQSVLLHEYAARQPPLTMALHEEVAAMSVEKMR